MWTRRNLLRATAVGASAAAVSAGVAGPAWAADEYDTLRARWLQMITGGSYDTTAEPFKTKLSWLASDAATYHASLNPSSTPLWSDLPLGTSSGNLNTTFSRLGALAYAYITTGSGMTGDATLLSNILTALDNLIANHYTPTASIYDNWWNWQIGIPQSLHGTMVMLYDNLGSTRIANYNAAVDHYVPDSSVSSYSGTSTGANRVDLCRVLALRGVLTKTTAKLQLARDALSPVFPLVCSSDGFYADGSFIQHGAVPYTGSYGAVLLDGFARLFALLAGSTWAVTDPNRQVVLDSVEKAYAPFLFNGLMMDGQNGRAISRGISIRDLHAIQADDHRIGHSVIASILQLSEAASTTEAARWKGLAKGWLTRDYWSPPMSDLSQGIPSLARFQALLNDSSVTAIAEPIKSQIFGSMDRSVHRRAAWAFALSLCSTRITFYEYGNGENYHGWHSSNGMTYWWGNNWGNGQYADAFWATVDPYRLPGTTVSRIALADGAGGSWGAVKPATTWAGGAADGTYSALGQDTRGLQSTLTAKKSWFCLDDSVVCLGAGITASDSATVETTVDNRNLSGGTGNQSFTVDGVAQSTTIGWSAILTNIGWAQLGGFGGYIFPGGATVKALREARDHSWSEVNINDTTTLINRKYLTLWFDHGIDPVGATYSYIHLPGATAATTSARAAAPTVTILANNASVQAISDTASGVTAANFFAAGSAGPITVSAPCSVVLRQSGSTLSVAVADPSRASTTVTVTLNFSGYSVASGDPQVGIVGLNPIKLVVEVGGSQGASRKITFGIGSAVTAGSATQLSPVADAYVRDGSFASTNYGSDTVLTVKNDGTGYARRAFLKFDVSGLAASPRRAVLWVYGTTADSLGSQATISAYTVADDSWTENGITWTNQPVLGSALSSGSIGDVNDWIALDVTSFIQAQYASDQVATIGLAEAALGRAVILRSRTNTTNPPILQLITS